MRIFQPAASQKKAAQKLAKVKQADLFEILPETPYTPADLDWTNKRSRSTVEMQDPNCRPAMANTVENLAQYDTVFLGFPIWWGREPSIVDTFLTSHDFSNKRIIPFYTSGGSGMGSTARRLQSFVAASAVVEAGTRLGGAVSEADLKTWTDGLNV